MTAADSYARTRPAGSSPPTVTVVVPARNEARNLAVVLPQLPPVHQVMLVDGHSVDGTIDMARTTLPDICVVQQTRKGKGNALACGFEAATGDIVVMFDADGSADAAEIPQFVDALVAGADFAKGSRFCPGGGSSDITRVRRWGNDALNGITNTAFKTAYSDLCYGYNAFWRDILPTLSLPSSSLRQRSDGRMLWGDGFEIETLISCRVAAAGLAIHEVPSVEKARIYGESNLSALRDGSRVLRTIASEKWRARRLLGQAARPGRGQDHRVIDLRTPRRRATAPDELVEETA